MTDTAASPPANRLARRLFSSRRYPLHFLVIPKCGCTYVKNLLWTLDHGSAHKNPLRIHRDDAAFARSADLGLSDADIRRERFAFTTVRHPIDRFLSLYLDKVAGDGHKRFIPLRRTLLEKHGLRAEPRDYGDHTYNCEILIEWLEANIAGAAELPLNPHWSPQINRVHVIRTLDLKVLLTSGLTGQLTTLVGSVAPEVKQVLSKSERNQTRRKVDPYRILSEHLRQRIYQVYGADLALYEAAESVWSTVDARTAGPDDVPRFSALPGKLQGIS